MLGSMTICEERLLFRDAAGTLDVDRGRRRRARRLVGAAAELTIDRTRVENDVWNVSSPIKAENVLSSVVVTQARSVDSSSSSSSVAAASTVIDNSKVTVSHKLPYRALNRSEMSRGGRRGNCAVRLSCFGLFRLVDCISEEVRRLSANEK